MSDFSRARFVDERDLLNVSGPAVLRKDWTAIIPAAGRGQRLGYDKPKILFPVAGRTILEWVLDEVEPLCEQFVFVLSPAGAPEVTPHLERLIPGRWSAVLQDEPKGMGDAVNRARNAVATPNSLVLWGDQVGVRRETIQACMKLHSMRPNAVSTCPTTMRKAPYIHFDRNPDGSLARILQAREGDEMPLVGENDCGLFLFQTQALFAGLETVRESAGLWGRQTKEFNLLPVFPLLDRNAGDVCSLRIDDLSQSIGVNTAADAEAASVTLRGRP